MLQLLQNGNPVMLVAPGTTFRLPNGNYVSPASEGWSHGGYSLVAHVEPEPDPPTPEEMLAAQFAAGSALVQTYVDLVAQQKEYSNGVHCVSYVGDPDPEYDAEARAFRNWRSAVWRHMQTIRESVIAGQAAPPAGPAELLQSLPTPPWPSPFPAG